MSIKKTFKHLTAGSTVIFKSGVVCRFMGQFGGVGFYETDKEDEIETLMELHRSPTAQVQLVEDESVAVLDKPIDPSIAKSAEDAAANTALETVGEVSAARDKLAAMISKSK